MPKRLSTIGSRQPSMLPPPPPKPKPPPPLCPVRSSKFPLFDLRRAACRVSFPGSQCAESPGGCNCRAQPGHCRRRHDSARQVALVTGSTSGIGLAIATGARGRRRKLMINGFGDPGRNRARVRSAGRRSTTAPTCRTPAAIEAMMSAARTSSAGRHPGQQCRHPACRAGRGIPAREMGRDHRHQPLRRLPHYPAGDSRR